MTSTPAATIPVESDALDATDAAIFAALEANYGGELGNVLGLYCENCDDLCQRLQEAAACAHWQEAVRLGLAIGHEADSLGFHRVARVARALADETYHAGSGDRLRNDAQMVVFEYERFRLALMAQFPKLVAQLIGSVA